MLAHQADGVLDQLADHALDVAAVVADLGVLGGLDLDERRAGERGQPAGDLGLADAGGADHEDVLGRDLLAHVVVELLPPPAVANGDGDGPLGVVLADDVAVELGNDLAGSQLTHGSSRLSLTTEDTENTEEELQIDKMTEMHSRNCSSPTHFRSSFLSRELCVLCG